jgi:hypothetical protein
MGGHSPTGSVVPGVGHLTIVAGLLAGAVAEEASVIDDAS